MNMKTKFDEIVAQSLRITSYEMKIETILKSKRSIPRGLQPSTLNTDKDILRFCRDAIGGKKSNDRFIVELTVEQLYAIAVKTRRCPLCGCVLDYQRGTHCRKTNGASLDRKDNENVVTKDNVWVICSMCNTTKSNRTLDEFIEYMRVCLKNYDNVK